MRQLDCTIIRDDEEVFKHTNTDEQYRLSRDPVESWISESPSGRSEEDTFANQFLAELQGAVETTQSDDGIYADRPFTKAQDIPLIGHEEDGSEDDYVIVENMPTVGETSRNDVDELCGFAEVHRHDNEESPSVHEPVEGYSFSWTGM